MAETPHTTGTQVPASQGSAFPPFATETFAAQLFWLTLTFVALLAAMWWLGVGRVGGAIAARKGKIEGDLATADAHRKDAEAASAAYDSALAAARARAQAVAEDNRKRVAGEVEQAKAKAEADAQAQTEAAEASIAESRKAARVHVTNAAQDAAAEIVAHLLGEAVPADEAAAAVRAATGS